MLSEIYQQHVHRGRLRKGREVREHVGGQLRHLHRLCRRLDPVLLKERNLLGLALLLDRERIAVKAFHRIAMAVCHDHIQQNGPAGGVQGLYGRIAFWRLFRRFRTLTQKL